MTTMSWLLALLPGATPPEEPMTRLLALDAAAFTRRARGKRQPGGTGHAVPDTTARVRG